VQPEFVGRYELIAELGRGGQATVYLARDPSLARNVAIKLLPHEFVRDSSFQERFRREARALARLRHPAIVPIYDFGEHDGRPFIVMEHLDGGSLSDYLRSAGSLQPDIAISILEQVASALDVAHGEGVVHRDLKPGNVLFDRNGRAYVADFGIAKLADTTQALTQGTMGTPIYMSPEQAEDHPITPASDIYALGVMAFEMLVGVPPFQATSPFVLMRKHVQDAPPAPSVTRPGLPASLDAPILAALAKTPAGRPPTAGAFAGALRAAISGSGTVTAIGGVPYSAAPTPALNPGWSVPPPASQPGRTGPTGRTTFFGKRPWVSAFGGVAVVVAIIAGIFVLKPGGGDDNNNAFGDDDDGTPTSETTRATTTRTTTSTRSTATPGGSATAVAAKRPDRYFVDYTVTTKSTGTDEKLALARDDQKTYMNASSSSGDETYSAIFIDDGEAGYACQKTSADDGLCFQTTVEEAEGTFDDTAFFPDYVSREGGYKAVADQRIAGRDANCFEDASTSVNDSICLDKQTGIVLVLDDGDQRFVANEFTLDARPDLFKPPYELLP